MARPDPAARALLEASERCRRAADALTHGSVASYRDARLMWGAPGVAGLLHVPSYAAGMRRALLNLALELERVGLGAMAAPLEDAARLLDRDGPPADPVHAASLEGLATRQRVERRTAEEAGRVGYPRQPPAGGAEFDPFVGFGGVWPPRPPGSGGNAP